MITNSKGQVVAGFVEIDNVRTTATYYTETDCSSAFDPVNGGAQYTSAGTKCDITANIYSSATNSCTSAMDPGCWFRIHTEFDHDWQGAAYCGPSTVCDPGLAKSQIIAQSTYIDVQGFVFWDPNHLTDQWHSFSGWELHALTAWRFHQSSSQADFGLSSSPSALSIVQGSSGKSIIALVSLNGFTGTVSLSSTVSPAGPTVTLNPTIVSLGAGGSASSTLTIGTTSATPVGSYMVTVTGTFGSVSHSAVVSVTVNSPSSQGDFAISVNPSSLTVSRSSSGTSAITLTSVNGFSGSVSLSAQASGPHIHLNTSPNSLTLTSGGSAIATLTISLNHKATPGSYAVTVTATSGSITHSAIIILTTT
jgi:hypothetical protein